MVRIFFSSFSRSGCDGHGSHGSGADGPNVFRCFAKVQNIQMKSNERMCVYIMFV